MIDSIITASIDHGTTPPSTHASRIVASSGVPLPSAVAAGILAIGDVHGGAIENSARIMQEWVKMMKKQRWDHAATAKKLLVRLKEENVFMPGFGHRIHTLDPRTSRLFSVSDRLKITGDCVKLTRAIEKEFARTKPLPVNVDGAIAAIISDMGFDWRLGKAFFLLGRAAGLIAHVHEEMIREKPMRRMCESEVVYDGPWERNLGAARRRDGETEKRRKDKRTKVKKNEGKKIRK